MAAHADLAERVKAIDAQEFYLSTPSNALLHMAQLAQAKPVVLNLKGFKAADCPVLLTLAEYERLLGQHTGESNSDAA